MCLVPLKAFPRSRRKTPGESLSARSRPALVMNGRIQLRLRTELSRSVSFL
jgi:hypothetical protein